MSENGQKPRRTRGLAIAALLALGLVLAPATIAGADELGQPSEPTADPVPATSVLCTYASKTYSVGAVVKFDTGYYYKCTADGWVYQGLIVT